MSHFTTIQNSCQEIDGEPTVGMESKLETIPSKVCGPSPDCERLGIHLNALRRVIQETKPRPPRILDPSPELHHGWLLPCLLQTDDFLWRRWHHWHQITVARKVVAPLPKIVWQENQAALKMLERSLSTITNQGDWRGWNSWAAFDYLMDWLLFGLGHKGQPKLPHENNDCRGASDRLYQVFTLETLLAYPHDYFGDLLAENRHGRHLGFYPTPMQVCELMVQMTLAREETRTKSVCDPCVGTGRMLLAASNHSYRLHGQDINPTVIKATLINGFLYAPWLVRPFPFLDPPVCDPVPSPVVNNSMVRQSKLQDTEHDAKSQWKFEPVKKRRFIQEPEQGVLL